MKYFADTTRLGVTPKCGTGVTLSRGLFENVLRELLVERAEHTVQLFEGSGVQWRKARCVLSRALLAPILCLPWLHLTASA